MFIKYVKQELTFCETSFWNQSQISLFYSVEYEKKKRVMSELVRPKTKREEWKEADINREGVEWRRIPELQQLKKKAGILRG